MEVSASNPFKMQAKLYAELTNDIFRYDSVPKNSLLKHKTPLSEPHTCDIISGANRCHRDILALHKFSLIVQYVIGKFMCIAA